MSGNVSPAIPAYQVSIREKNDINKKKKEEEEVSK